MMSDTNPQEYNLFTSKPNYNDLFSDQPPGEDDLYPPYGSPEDDLFPNVRPTKEDVAEVDDFADAQGLAPISKKRLVNYYRDIYVRQNKARYKDKDSLY
jgi:hypothetical protein